MKLEIPTYSSDMFSWKGKSGVAEMSDFNDGIIAEPVYDDACDVGFNVRSERTGKTKLFTYFGLERDTEGELVAEIYTSEDGVVISLLND